MAAQDGLVNVLGVILGVKAQGGLVKPILFTGAKTVLFLFTVWAVYRLVRYSQGAFSDEPLPPIQHPEWMVRDQAGKPPRATCRALRPSASTSQS